MDRMRPDLAATAARRALAGHYYSLASLLDPWARAADAPVVLRAHAETQASAAVGLPGAHGQRGLRQARGRPWWLQSAPSG